MFDTGEFTKGVRDISSQLFLCRGIYGVYSYSVTNSWDNISRTLPLNSPVCTMYMIIHVIMQCILIFIFVVIISFYSIQFLIQARVFSCILHFVVAGPCTGLHSHPPSKVRFLLFLVLANTHTLLAKYGFLLFLVLAYTHTLLAK